MVRQFKHHEKKLLKKVDFFNVRIDLVVVLFYFSFHTASIVETRCEPSRDQNYAQISHTGSGGLPQVRTDNHMLRLLID